MSPTIVAIGEILWDQFPGFRRLGGAPFNLAAHAARLGLRPWLISGVGADPEGEEALRQAEALGVNTSLVCRHPSRPTGIVEVTLDDGGHPSYHLCRPAAWEEPRLGPGALAILEAASPTWVVCGTLQQTCPEAAAVRRSLGEYPLFYDVNLRPGFEDPATVAELLRAATAVKCNDDELVWLNRHFDLGADPARGLLSRYGLQTVCVTLGPQGCRLLSADEDVQEVAPKVAVADTVGAGDAFAAAVLAGFCAGLSLRVIARRANALGAVVASQTGAIPDWTEEQLAAATKSASD